MLLALVLLGAVDIAVITPVADVILGAVSRERPAATPRRSTERQCRSAAVRFIKNVVTPTPAAPEACSTSRTISPYMAASTLRSKFNGRCGGSTNMIEQLKKADAEVLHPCYIIEYDSYAEYSYGRESIRQRRVKH